ncbi:hypothetical protein [Methylomarinum vadi]|uniref:hypothetical protein n=1 Tax=Methylomarinum vadi TaxID=438855 RepID=UPI0004DF7A50|nr:hypothetical protein [Methylomarinum vadi]
MNSRRIKQPIYSALLFIVLLIALLPLAFILTLVLEPFWQWIERNHAIEAVGHSGPAEWCFLLVYAVCVLMTGSFYNHIKAVTGMIILVSTLLILLPLPHGGFLGGAIWHEMTTKLSDFDRRERPSVAEIDSTNSAAKLTPSPGRFAGTLPFDENFARGSWRIGTVMGSPAWLENNSGMIWGGRQDFRLSGWSQADLQTARTGCRAVEPRGFWSLPTNAEFALGVESQMQTIIDDIEGRWIAQSHIFEGAKPFPSLVGFAGGNDNAPGQKLSVSVRCIGRSAGAPARGYFRRDISNADAMKLLTR